MLDRLSEISARAIPKHITGLLTGGPTYRLLELCFRNVTLHYDRIAQALGRHYGTYGDVPAVSAAKMVASTLIALGLADDSGVSGVTITELGRLVARSGALRIEKGNVFQKFKEHNPDVA